LRFIFFVIIQIFLSPITIIGYIYSTIYLFVQARRTGISLTGSDMLNVRWMLHRSGVRTDEAVVRMISRLPITTMAGLKMVIFPLELGEKLTGHVPAWFKFVEPGKESLSNMINARTEFFDESLGRHLGEMDQVVFMGAGYDTRAYKFCQGQGVETFEIDTESTQAYKIKALKEAGLDTEWIHFVPVDFNNEFWLDKLTKEGFERGKKNFFLWEGVTLYLPEEVVRQTIKTITEASTEGSVVAFDVYSLSFVNPDSLLLKMAAKSLKVTGENFQYGLDLTNNQEEQISDLLKGSGLNVNRFRIMGRPENKFGQFACLVEAVIKEKKE
jgi:methyltransferase (TIGR00027 family)